MRGKDDARAFFNERFQRGQRGADACVIIDDHRAAGFLHRHIVVHPRKYAFSLQIQVVNSQFRHNGARRIAHPMTQ